MLVFKYKNSAGTSMVRLVADYGYTLTKDGHNYQEAVSVPESEMPDWEEVKKAKSN